MAERARDMIQEQPMGSAHRPGNQGQPLFSRPLPDGPLTRCASLGFRAAVALRNNMYTRLSPLSWKAPCPVISVGAISAGGTGKTPVSLLVGTYLQSKGWNVAFLSRGYRRIDRRPRIVAPREKIDWELIGDEPWLLHDRLPDAWLCIDSRRRRSARMLASRMPGRPVFVLDDGFQHRALRRDLDLVCLHHAVLHDHMIPRGYLREPVVSLGRAGAALLIGGLEERTALEDTRNVLAGLFPHLPVFILFQQKGDWINAGTGEKRKKPPSDDPLLVCGIARPERFLAMVRADGIQPSGQYLFSDHHRFITNDFNKTRELYSKVIISTEKDAVRLCHAGIVPAEQLWYLTLEVRFFDETRGNQFFTLIDKHIY
jgi:tetraacyldisaccharide 4'-kinase